MKSTLTLKLVLPLMAFGMLLLGVGVVGALYVHQLQQRASEILAINVASIRAAEELEIVLRETRYNLNQFLLRADRTHLERIPALEEQTKLWLAEAKRLATTPQEQKLIEQIERGYEDFERGLQTLGKEQSEDVSREEIRHLAAHVLPNEILKYTREYLDANERDLARSSEENNRLANRLVWGLLLLGSCGVVAGYTVALAVRRSIVQLSVLVHDVEGKLSRVAGPFTVTAGADIKTLDSVLREISGRVTTVVEQLQAAQRDVLRAEQLAAVGQLAAGLAHELRNPLMAVKILVQSAVDRSEQGGLDSRDLAIIEEEIARLEHLVQMFLDFGRPPQLQKRRCDLRAIVERSVRLFAQRAERREVALRLHLPDHAVGVEVDETQIHQVILNLLLNALDAVPNGSCVELEVAQERCADGKGWAVIYVSDNGCGLPPELGTRIFDPFVSSKETGIGLGLSICRRIVETHEGEMDAANRPDCGAVFTIRVPSMIAPQQEANPPSGFATPLECVGETH